MAYDFSRFSPQSFERMIQALAVATAGRQAQIYGAGRDGAREATFEGRLVLEGKEWDGYTVFQAKHRETVAEPASNADWLIAQLNAELEKFTDLRRSLRKPDFYVLASNVRLSAGAADVNGKNEGGVDKVTRHLKEKAEAVGIRDVHLWHADTLTALLDSHPGVRQSYDFFVQPGDVLARILRDLEGPDQAEVLKPYLRRSLRQARDIKTKDIGQAIGRTVRIDEVFIDLPIDRQNPTHLDRWFQSSASQRPSRHAEIDEVDAADNLADIFSTPTIAAELMRRAASKFEPQDGDHTDVPSARFSHRAHMRNRIVLLGGPGQGKSTVGQFLAQLCRARLLDTLRTSQTESMNEAISAVLDCARAEDIPLTGPPRYPFHVELPRYADALSAATREEKSHSILTHIAQDVSKSGDRAINTATLHQWLKTLPALIILDGLDEVPRSGNREHVLGAIEDLLDAICDANSDCLVFCTSREQGYQEELDPRYWSHWKLSSLSSEAALRLAARVANILVTEEVRRDDILTTLAGAAEDATTAPLMISPLQVMLLFQLASTYNNIPKARWTLFQRHYDTFRDREIAKGGATGALIGQFGGQIDAIHRDTGYLLHLRAEKAGGAEAYLTQPEFEAIVAAQLIQDGFLDDVPALAKQIAELATNRLVFLRTQVDGQVSFDVRSLQEFMAAARLTSSPETWIIERLQAIAGRSHWLHVFKIACSKIYGTGDHQALRSLLVGLLDSLDEGDRCQDDRLLRMGARLALHLLQDGTARNVPVYRRHLTSRALRLLSVRDENVVVELAPVLNFNDRSHLEPLLRERIDSGDSELRMQTLRLLAYGARYAAEDGRDWSAQLLLERWPEAGSDVLALFSSAIFLPDHPAIADRLRVAQWGQPYPAVAEWLSHMLQEMEENETELPDDVFVCRRASNLSTVQFILDDKTPTNLRILYRGLSGTLEIVGELPADHHPSWTIAQIAACFAEEPTLALARRFLEAQLTLDDEPMRAGLPWPLRGLLHFADGRGGIAAALRALGDGELGNVEEWQKAEERWRDEGLHADDLIAFYSGNAMASDWPCRGAPLPVAMRPGRGISALDALLRVVIAFPNEYWPHKALFQLASRSEQDISPAVISFLETFDAGRVSDSVFAWRFYLRALAVAYSQAPSPRLFDKIIGALPHAAPLIPDLTGARSGLVERFLADERDRFLLPGLAASLRDRSFEDYPLLPEAAFTILETDSVEIKSGVALLRINFERTDASDPVAIQALLASSPAMFGSLIGNLARGRWREADRDVALAICRAALLDKTSNRYPRYIDYLISLVEARPAALSEADALRLELPLPLAERPSPMVDLFAG